jgi:hypothetical protein
MMAATSRQSIVLINVAPLCCDAFLSLHHCYTSLNLPLLREATIKEVAADMESRCSSKSQLLELLEWFWDVLAGPVFYELGFREAATNAEQPWPRHMCSDKSLGETETTR